ncbi:S8 family serine peptidase [Flavobacterium sp. MXW15]|uniref:S8 family serine peptidase n=1 Tax=Xanthomonas chitinilytica TaxID=2989819 RepID=A0ABT3JSB5_9XANT|nr:S8 family peptidase [Xanthomonas sp. H13-6]MCW4454091.1 S8 family serine peptidase [Flavobacterium sp. MXW15]MCW4471325.1 S8 family serine peptidase [Xanthomonas sp. H13-6]
MSLESQRRLRPRALAVLGVSTLSLLLAVPAFAGEAHLDGLASAPTHQRFIVKYRDGSQAVTATAQASSLKAAAAALPARSGRALGVQKLRELALGPSVIQTDRALDQAEAAQLMRQLAADPNVEYVEVDQIMRPTLNPNDPRLSEQWGFGTTNAGINVRPAWDKATGTGVVVAVIDTGITNHPDLNANILPGYDFISDAAMARDGNGRDNNPADEGDWYGANECGVGYPASGSSWHGTHVAGTVAAVTNNATGVAGTAFNAKIVPVRVLGKCGGYTSDIADAIVWASGGTVSGVPANANPAEVINMSLGGSGSCSSTYQNAINGAVSRGTTVVVAAGNSNANVSTAVPANCANVIAVAATTSAGARASFSNYGAGIDISAPGQAILSTLNTGTTVPASPSYASYNGTSMAAPHVAGVVALMQSAASTPLSPATVESIIKSTARPLPGACSGGCGAGIVDADAAVVAAQGGGGGDPGPGTGELQNNVPVTGLSAATGASLNYTFQVPAGASQLVVQISGGSGDADLYVRHGSAPTDTVYNCRPYQSGNNETCTINAPASGTWHIRVKAYSAFSGVSLVANQTGGSGGGNELQNNVPVTGLSGAAGASLNYTFPVPAGTSQLVVQMSGGSGDADLYVRHGSAPTDTAYNCRPYLNGNNETCTINAPASGTWHIRVKGYTAFSGVSLRASR